MRIFLGTFAGFQTTRKSNTLADMGERFLAIQSYPFYGQPIKNRRMDRRRRW